MKLVVLTKGKKRPLGYKTPGGYIKTAKGWRKAPKGEAPITTKAAPAPPSVEAPVEKSPLDLTGKFRVRVRKLRTRTTPALLKKNVYILKKISATEYEVRVPGGYGEKTGRLVLKREGSIDEAHIRVGTQDFDVLGLELGQTEEPEKFTTPPKWSAIDAMSGEQLISYNARNFNIAVLDKITPRSRKMWANLTYQVEMLHYLGFKNPSYLVMTIEDAIPSDDPGATVMAQYSHREPKITVGKRYKNSFVHEYFHHVWSKSLDLRDKAVFSLEVEKTLSYRRFKKIDAGRDHPYYSTSTEIAARFGNQLIYNMLKEKDIDTAVRMVSAPMTNWTDLTAGDFASVRRKVKEFFKALRKRPLVVLLKAAHKLQGRIDFQGLPISIENRKGSVRKWYDPMKDEHGETKMKYAYGYIRATKGNDGDSIDCYIGPNKESRKVFVVHQNNPKTGKYDEDKVMLGFDSAVQAKKAYLVHYDDPKFLGSIEEMSFDDFQNKVTRKQKGKVKKVVKVTGG